MQRLLVFVISASLLCGQLPPVPSTPVAVVYDDDLCTDSEGPMAFSNLIYLMQNAYVNLLAVVTTLSANGVGPYAESFLSYSGLHRVPVGTYQGGQTLGYDSYCAATAAHFGLTPRTLRTEYPTGVQTYRQALAISGGITLLATGFLTNLSSLMQSSGDSISPLTGMQLINAKVGKLVIMGGNYPSSVTPEFNFAGDPASAAYVFANWPSSIPIYLVGYDLGVMTDQCGAGIQSGLGVNTFLYYSVNPIFTRPCWDNAAVTYAVLGTNGVFTVSAGGTNTVNASTGNNAWSATPNNNQYYLIWPGSGAAMATYMNALIVHNTAALNPSNIRNGVIIKNGGIMH